MVAYVPTDVLTLLFATALAFPIPAAPPIPVTTPVLGRPQSRQSGLRVASNGSIALAVWNDQRTGSDVTAARVNADGMPLDPTGILIQADATLFDVFWTGSSFAVVTRPNAQPSPGFSSISSVVNYDYLVTYVDSDGNATQSNRVPSSPMRYAGHSNDGSDAHLLFLPADGFSRLALVVDLTGKVIRQGSTDAAFASVLAASNGSEFLVVRQFVGSGGAFVAETLDRDGNWGDSNDPQLPATFVPAALTADGRGGFVLFGYLPSQKELALVHLDAKGVAASAPQFIQTYDPAAGQPTVTATTSANRFAASWNLSAPNGHTYTYVSRDGGAPEKRFDWTGAGLDAAYDPVNDLVLTSCNEASTSTDADVFVQKGSRPPVPLTYSATFQMLPAIAAGANGFLVAWTENSGTELRIYARRFASDGTPLDEAQVATSTPITDELYPGFGFTRVSVTSSGDAYLVVWDGLLARRMDARTGRWLDAVPFSLAAPMPLSEMAAASNGSDVLALMPQKCPSSPCGLVARRVAMSGSALVSYELPLSDGPAGGAAIASDGTNYLAVWSDSRGLVAMRLRPDGSQIDAAPIVLDPSGSGLKPSIAWNGQTYLVIWNGTAAAYVGSDGAVRHLGVIANFHAEVSWSKAVAHDGTFLILSRHWPPYLSTPYFAQVLSVTLLDGSTTTLDIDPTDLPGLSYNTAYPDAVSDGAHLLLAYAHIDAQAGRVSRVVIDPRVFPSRKRSVR